jgi:antitoxin component of RelBE/YafQ-DinJ toxin-antitoxin module
LAREYLVQGADFKLRKPYFATTKFKTCKKLNKGRMSASFGAALEKVSIGKYVDQIQSELKKILSEVGPGKTPQQVEATQQRLQELIRKQAKDLSKELGISGSHVMVFMTATSIISTAWLSFALRKETTDLSKSPEDRLVMIDMLDSLGLALARVIEISSDYADRAAMAGGEGPTQQPSQESSPE